MAAHQDSAASGRRLHLVFEDAQTFVNEYERNLMRGGAMIASRDVFDMREVVEVLLEAPFAGKKLVLQAEVVHANGDAVAVQFLDAAPDLREKLEPLRERAAAAASPQRGADGLVEAPGDDLGSVSFQDDDVELDPTALDGATKVRLPPDDGDPNERTFRARAERARARVPVRVKGPTGKSLRARTRDLSHTGVLLSVDGEELPLGRDVQVSLVNPANGDQLTVAGKVVRHLEADGVIGAVAVELRPGDQGPDVERLVADIQKADAEHQQGGIRGPLEELGGASMLQMFAALSKRGTLTVSHGVEEGCVAFAEGMLLFAQVGSVTGVKALARILSWRDGFFEFRAHVDPGDCEEPNMPIEGAILEAVRVLDEGNRLSGPVVPPSARLELARDRLAESGPLLGKTEQAVLELAAAGFTVRRILDVIPEDDAAIRVAITSLLERGIVRVAAV
jgi:hypothetical protein